MGSDNTIEYITRSDWSASRLGLERISELLERLGNPEKRLKLIHVAGTNGKGSVCSMLSSVLTAAGYRTGMFTSPFVNRFNEHIQVDGACINHDELASATDAVRHEADQMDDHPTEFELLTCIAMMHFLAAGCDFAVVEVGLGGRLDATNAIPSPVVAVITPVSLDHTNELGDTLEKIAAEKAGIIKPGCSVVISPQQPGAETVIQRKCDDWGVRLHKINPSDINIKEATLNGQRFDYGQLTGLETKLLGAYQAENAAVVATVAYVLREKGWRISDDAIHEGLSKATWPARFEVLNESPMFILDGGHNPQCVDSLIDNLNTFFPGGDSRKQKRFTFIVGVMADKDFEAMFGKIIPLAEKVYTVTPDNPRALDAVELAGYFRNKGIPHVKACDSVENGVKEALLEADRQEVICAFGSLYMSGRIRGVFGLN